MKYAFYVSGQAGRLRKILCKNTSCLEQTRLVVSDDNQNMDIAMALQEKGITYELIDYKRIKGNKNLQLSNRMLSLFLKYEIDYCFSFGNHILKGELLEQYKNHIINFHPSILPMFRGRNAIDQAVEQNTFLLGCSAHMIDEGMDTGLVIMQGIMSSEVFRKDGYDGVMDIEIEMLEKIVAALNEGRLLVSDDEVRILGEDYYKKIIFP